MKKAMTGKQSGLRTSTYSVGEEVEKWGRFTPHYMSDRQSGPELGII